MKGIGELGSPQSSFWLNTTLIAGVMDCRVQPSELCMIYTLLRRFFTLLKKLEKRIFMFYYINLSE